MGVRLPAEYQEVEYLEGTGTQYIDTNIVLQNEKDIYIISDFLICDNASGNNCIMGIQAGATSGMKFPNWCSGNIEIRGYGISTNSAATLAINNRARMIFDYKDGSQIVLLNNETLINSSNSWTSGREEPLCIFATSMTGGTAAWMAKARIYGVTVRLQNAEYIFVPCYRKSDDEPGMYDLVSKTFYTNQGTGEFLVGPDVVNHISPRLMDRRRALIAKLTSLFRKVITSQTGLVSFDTNVAKPMKITCEFRPKQDLHGYDNPWPAGGGVNIWDEQWELGSISTTDGVKTSSTTIIRSKNKIPVVSGRQYRIVDTLSEGIYMLFYDENDNVVQYVKESGDNVSVSSLSAFISDNASRLATAPQNAVYCLFRIKLTTYTSGIAINYPASVTTYSPYENICPIEAWNGANVKHRSKNLIIPDDPANPMQNYMHTSTGTVKYDSEIGGFYSDGSGIAQSKHAGINDRLFIADADMTVTFSVSYYCVPGGTFGLRFRVNGGYAENIGYGISDETWHRTSLVRTLHKGDYIDIDFYSSIYWKDMQVEIGSVATDYEPYQGTTLPIPFNNPGTYDFLPIQAGTGDPSPENIRPITPGLTLTRDDNTTLEVYGGSLTVNADGTGTITSKYYQCVYDGANKKVNSSYLSDTFICAGDVYCNPNGQLYARENLFSDKLRASSPYDTAMLYQVVSPAAGMLYLTFKVGLTEGSGVTNAAECIAYVNNWLQNNPTSVVYKLLEADYQTYTLSVAETSRAFEALGLGKKLGPLYGGSVMINEDGSADVVVDHGIHNGSALSGYPYRGKSGFINIPAMKLGNGGARGVCSILPIQTNPGSNDYSDSPIALQYGWDDYKVILWKIGNLVASATGVVTPTKAQIETFLSEHNFAFTYPLDTPQTYHFSSISELQSFLGTNNVWSDLNGPITVEYYKKQQ